MANNKSKSKKSQWTNKDRGFVMDYMHKNKGKSYAKIVDELRAEYPDRFNTTKNLLMVNTIKTWENRYKPAEQKIMCVSDGHRIRPKTYPELREDVFNEIVYRDENNILRDIETMQIWSVNQAEKYVAARPKYANFKGSRHFIQDIIDEFNLHQRKETGTSVLSWADYLIKRREWIEDERIFAMDNDLIVDGYIDDTCVDNTDEVPIYLRGKARKQITARATGDVKVLKFPCTFDVTKRFATINPTICCDGSCIGIFAIMRGSPSKREISRYPVNIGWSCNESAWMRYMAWMNFAVYYRRRCRSLRRNATGRVCYSDNYGVHSAYQSEFEDGSRNDEIFYQEYDIQSTAS